MYDNGVNQALHGARVKWHIIQRYMTHTSCTVLPFACLLLATIAWGTAKEETLSPESLISRARLQQEIWTEGTPSMSMRAELQPLDAKGAMIQGAYTFDWVSTSQWKETIKIGNYERLRVRDAKGYWQKSALSYQPEIIFQLELLLHLKEALRLEPKQTLTKLKKREKDGVRQRCTEVKWQPGTDRILCFDEVNGSLASIEYPTGDHQSPPEISRIEYDVFKPAAGKFVPYETRALRGRKVVAAVKILEISKITEENPALFHVPEDAEFWAYCDDMQEAELVDRVQPRYPTSARMNREQGRVILYGVIEPDGSLSHLALIQRATPDLEAATVQAVPQWHYKPAARSQTPIRMETSIPADFWLQN
jgi:TonB family protein